MSDVDLTGEVALITGASRGIGAATAKVLAETGAKVVLAARDEAGLRSLANEIGDAAVAVRCDVSSFEDVQGAVAQAISSFGKLTVLVNNAGIIDPIARLDDSDPEAWGNVVDVNLKGVYYGLRAGIPAMLEAGGGTVVNISSGAATGALEGWSHYCATKAAVLSLTKCADKEFRDQGIRVIGLSPGTVATDMQVSIKSSGINPVSQLDPSVHISPDWAARAVAWICTPAADPYRGTDFTIKTDEGRALVGLA